jgi:hypothetical protein
MSCKVLGTTWAHKGLMLGGSIGPTKSCIVWWAHFNNPHIIYTHIIMEDYKRNITVVYPRIGKKVHNNYFNVSQILDRATVRF